MKNSIQVFRNEMFGEIRTLTNEKCEVFFIGKDVAQALGYKNPSNALQVHVDEEDKTAYPIQVSGSNYKTKVVFINESGLYSLILSSKLEQAKAFKRWVTSEVLPQIGRTGGYIPTTNPRTGEPLSPEEMVRVADSIMAKTIAKLNLPADDCLSASEVAKLAGVNVKDLNSFLVDQGVQYRAGSGYKICKNFQGFGYTQERMFYYFGLKGEKKQRPYLVWTPKGVKMIKKMLRIK